jgi:hypothetical protein
MLKTVRHNHWWETQLWGLCKTQVGLASRGFTHGSRLKTAPPVCTSLPALLTEAWLEAHDQFACSSGMINASSLSKKEAESALCMNCRGFSTLDFELCRIAGQL